MLKLFDNRNQPGGAWSGLEAWQAPDARLEQAPLQDVALDAAVEPEFEPELQPLHKQSQQRQSAKLSSAPLKTIAFVGASGGVGKTTIAINVAFELASAGHRVALVDLDIANPTLLATLGQEAITPGLAGVRRLVGQGRFKADDLDRMLMVLNFDGVRISVLAGLPAPLSPDERLDMVAVARELLDALSASYDYVVIDLPATGADAAFAFECLPLVDASFAICGADPVGVQRFLWLVAQWRKHGLSSEPQIIVNGVRDSVLGSNPKRQLADTIERLAGSEVTVFVVHDQAAFDLALREGLPLSLAKKASAARHAISMFVRQGLLGQRTNLDWRVARNG